MLELDTIQVRSSRFDTIWFASIQDHVVVAPTVIYYCSRGAALLMPALDGSYGYKRFVLRIKSLS